MTKSNTLAINGGIPVLDSTLPAYTSIGKEERIAVMRAFDRGSLSGFYGNWGPEFLGGDEVNAFESTWANKFGVPYAVSVNSATSGLYAALAAHGIGPGDEVIVPPTTMSATVMGPLLYGAIPVFADIEDETFCLDINKVKAEISPKTKAVIAVNLFGHPARLHDLAELCRQHNIGLIEDNAQGPLASENEVYAGTVGDIGVFSLNYHKHIHTGEGGMCVTRSPELALRLQAIRNHAENIVEPGRISLVNMIGFNYRMTEMSAAVGIAQLEKIEQEVSKRQQLAEYLSDGLRDLDGIIVPVARSNCRHVYYVWAFRVDEQLLGVSRDKFSAALAAEGFPHFVGYVQPLYLLPAFQQRIAIGHDGWPFTLSDRDYAKGLCPVAERMYERELICFETCAYDVNEENAQKLVDAVRKVHTNRSALK